MKSIKNHFVKNINIKSTTPPSKVSLDNKQHEREERGQREQHGQHECDLTQPQHGQRGFTIIEVALVLAIAGLIFLVVFLALPALQNSQKDTARRQDVGRVVSALQQYEADHGGAILSLGAPSAYTRYYTNKHNSGFASYIGDLSKASTITIEEDNEPRYHPCSDHCIDVYTDESCAPSGSINLVSKPGTNAVVVELSSGNYYCASM